MHFYLYFLQYSKLYALPYTYYIPRLSSQFHVLHRTILLRTLFLRKSISATSGVVFVGNICVGGLQYNNIFATTDDISATAHDISATAHDIFATTHDIFTNTDGISANTDDFLANTDENLTTTDDIFATTDENNTNADDFFSPILVDKKSPPQTTF